MAPMSVICTMRRSWMARSSACSCPSGIGNVRVIDFTIEPRIAAGCTRPSSRDDHDPQVLGAEQPLAAVEDLLEDRCRVGDRAADHLQHLGGGSLLLQRFLRFVEQPHVLDRDHGLVGKGLQQRELLVAERAGASRHTPIEPTTCAFAQHRHGEVGTVARAARLVLQGVVRIVERRRESGPVRCSRMARARIEPRPASSGRRCASPAWLRSTRHETLPCAPAGRRSATTAPMFALHRVIARSAIASNTGCTSVGDSLMTRSTSAVAVWRSSASFVSLNSRAFWIAMTAWSAKVLSSASSASENGRGGRQHDIDGANAAAFPRHRRVRDREVADSARRPRGCTQAGPRADSTLERCSTEPCRIAMSLIVPASGRGNACSTSSANPPR